MEAHAEAQSAQVSWGMEYWSACRLRRGLRDSWRELGPCLGECSAKEGAMWAAHTDLTAAETGVCVRQRGPLVLRVAQCQ